MTFKKGEYTKRPSGNWVLGSFIESGWGRQVSGMWAEMIYNRSFREVPPRKWPAYTWMGFEEEYYNSAAPFWHSGYEEYDWEPIGNPELVRTLGEETHKGKSSLIVKNAAGGQCGLKQEGIHLKQGMDYNFRIFCGQSEGRLSAGGAMSSFGQNLRTAEERILKISVGPYSTAFDISGDPALHEWTFHCEADTVCTISLEFDWIGDLILAFTSLMPADNIRGWRADVVEKIRQAGPTVVRFPGGCFVSFFDWKTAIGSRDEREPQESFYWGGLEENDVGLAEFMDLAELCGFEPQICFNMMTSSPFDARCMVEYLNAPADVGYGRLRALHGHPEPWNVRLFECDNEVYRKWNAIQYAEKCVEFAREMRLASPDIEFMMVIYTYDIANIPKMLEIAGGDINYVTHRDGTPETVATYLPIIREYNQKHNTDIRLVNTEWLPSSHSPEPFDNPNIDQNYEWDAGIHNDYDKVFSRHQISWNYALNGAHRVLDYMSYGGDFALGNFNNMANTFGQNLVEASKDMAWLSCMGEVFALFKRQFAPCVSALAETGDPLVFALFAKGEDGKEKLYVINHGSAEKTYTLPEGFTRACDGLVGPCRSAHVTEKDKPVKRLTLNITDGIVTLPGLSFVCFE